MNGRVLSHSRHRPALILAGAAWAYAQAPSVNIEFRFVAAGKTLNAGTYSVDVSPSGNVVLTAAEGGAAVEFPDTKKLNDRKFDRPELMFDVVGSARILAQVKLPGKGHFVVGRQEGAEEQETVKGPRRTSRRRPPARRRGPWPSRARAGGPATTSGTGTAAPAARRAGPRRCGVRSPPTSACRTAGRRSVGTSQSLAARGAAAAPACPSGISACATSALKRHLAAFRFSASSKSPRRAASATGARPRRSSNPRPS